jgi:hypothetical protein
LCPISSVLKHFKKTILELGICPFSWEGFWLGDLLFCFEGHGFWVAMGEGMGSVWMGEGLFECFVFGACACIFGGGSWSIMFQTFVAQNFQRSKIKV